MEETEAELYERYRVTRPTGAPKIEAGEPELNISERQQKNLATSGLRAITEIEEMIKKDPTLLVKAALPGTLFARSFEAAAWRSADALLRLRTGAVAPREEIERYVKAYLPRLGDTSTDIENKIRGFYDDMSQYLVGLPAGTTFRVIERSTGQHGVLPVEEFDYNLYQIE